MVMVGGMDRARAFTPMERAVYGEGWLAPVRRWVLGVLVRSVVGWMEALGVAPYQ